MDYMTLLTLILAISAVFSTFSAIYLLWQNYKFRKNDKSELLCEKHHERTTTMENELNKQKIIIELLKSEKANNTDVIKIFAILDNLTKLVTEIRDTIYHNK